MRKYLILILLLLLGGSYAQARESSEIVRLSWQASKDGDLKTLTSLVDEITQEYGQQAKTLSSQLSTFPSHDKNDNYKVMSDVATAMFIKAEATMHQGKNDDAIAQFKTIIAQYPWAQCFDPSRGSYWSIAEKSQSSIDVMQGKAPQDPVPVKQGPKTIPVLKYPGEEVVDWAKYGKFLNVGTQQYHYQITDQAGLVAALGEGIYPNIADVYKDPGYKKAIRSGRLKGNHWDFVATRDLQAAFYKWITAPESWGVRLFYIGETFEKAGMLIQAIKAYDSLIVNFPGAIAWTYWQTPWYPAQAAVYKIQYLIRIHPELHLEFKGAKIHINNPDDAHNFTVSTNPGILRKLSMMEIVKEKLNIKPTLMPLGKPVFYSGQGQVRFVKYESGHWQLLVDNKPFFIKGMSYMPTKVGQSPDDGTMVDWMQEDDNHDGKISAPYEAWVDKYGDNKRHPDEPIVGDFQLMKEMGVNTLRIYYQPAMKADKPFLEQMYKGYGFKVAMSNFLGKYAIGSGATWSEGTDYENPVHQKHMMDYVREMVMEFKDEPYILMWILGNENNYGVASNADKKPDAYYKFVNEVAKMIKSIDPNHPVAICNGDTLFLEKFGKYDPDVDAFGANIYRGNYGFGSFWDQVAEDAGKPAFVTEYGAPSFALTMSYQQSQQEQADYHKGNWLDILDNSAGYQEGVGNSVGGMAFEWLDEWWKNYSPAVHDTKADAVGPFPGGYYFEEWFGIMGQGDGSQSPYLREPRKVYYTYKDLWNS
jgi:hypothetical protein